VQGLSNGSTQVTNRLESCLEEAVSQKEITSLAWIEERHRELAKEAGCVLCPGRLGRVAARRTPVAQRRAAPHARRRAHYLLAIARRGNTVL